MVILLGERRAGRGARFRELFGAVSGRVAYVEVELESGWTQRVPVLRAPQVPAAGFVLAFVPVQRGVAIPVTHEGERLEPWQI
jgi:hypothetical protein